MTNSSPTHDLGSLTTSEIVDQFHVLLVPLGATEQHGPHLPLATDTILASAWAHCVADALHNMGIGAVVAPTLPYGSSGEHQAFPGTISIGQDALHQVLVELTRSAAESFASVAFLSGHAGNLEPVTNAVSQLRDEGHDVQLFFPQWPTDVGAVLDAHAGRTETSLMLHVDPGAVQTDRIETGDTRRLSDVMAELVAGGVGAVSSNGVLGDPTGASAEEGSRLMTSLVDRTVERLRRFDAPR